jgi:hypothetical protein
LIELCSSASVAVADESLDLLESDLPPNKKKIPKNPKIKDKMADDMAAKSAKIPNGPGEGRNVGEADGDCEGSKEGEADGAGVAPQSAEPSVTPLPLTFDHVLSSLVVSKQHARTVVLASAAVHVRSAYPCCKRENWWRHWSTIALPLH